MVKKLLKAVLGLFSDYVTTALAAKAEFGPQLTVPGFKSNSSYTAYGATKYVIVAANGVRGAQLATDPGSSLILGVMQNNPDVGEAMVIAYSGPSKVVAGGSLTANAVFTTDASGHATVVRSGDIAVGRCLETAANASEVVGALLFPPFRWFGAP